MYFSTKGKKPLAAGTVILQKKAQEKITTEVQSLSRPSSAQKREEKKNAHHLLPHPSQSLASQKVFSF